jgi:hypothetical protein
MQQAPFRDDTQSISDIRLDIEKNDSHLPINPNRTIAASTSSDG